LYIQFAGTGAGPGLVVSARNQEIEKQQSWPCVALLVTASPLRLMGPKWSTLGCPLHAFIGKAALPDIGLQCSQPHHGSEHGQRRANAVLAVAGHDRARPRCRTPPLQVLVLKMMPVFALIEPRADEHATQGANTGRDIHCGGLHVDQGEEVTRQLRKTTACLSRVTFCTFDQL